MDEQPEEPTRSELRMVLGAIRRRWPIPDALRQELIDLAASAMRQETSERRQALGMKVILAADDQNLRHEALDLARERHAAGRSTEGTLADCVADAERLAGEREIERRRESG